MEHESPINIDDELQQFEGKKFFSTVDTGKYQ